MAGQLAKAPGLKAVKVVWRRLIRFGS